MTCFRPLHAWQTEGGEVVFAERGAIRRSLELPCGQCVGCRLERSRVWAMRCVHEAAMYDFSSFVTLTYADDVCPVSLRYGDFQRFMKRVRHRFGPTRFFCAGEYGGSTGRPHFHALLFGVFFTDRVLHSSSGEFPLYRSPVLASLWPYGFASVGDVSFESAAYCARYIMSKVTGDAAESHYERVDTRSGEVVSVVPEFCRMSLKPGIGARWFECFRTDVFGVEKDSVVVNGVACKPPRYYKEYLGRLDWNLAEHIDFRRATRSSLGVADRTPERLAVREVVTKARVARLGRKVD